MVNKNKTLGIVFLIGAGIGGYFLWKYLKDKEEENGIPPPIDPKGFVLFALPFYKQDGIDVNEPYPGKEFDIFPIAINKSGEIIEGYCDIISDSEIVFSETISANPNDIKTFQYTTMMLETEMNFTVEFGRIIDLEKVKDYSIDIKITPGEEPPIPLGVSAEIISTGFMEV